ncbi:phosphoribosylglycinamide formyltransferase [Corynebacterium epidermidicanis]|uniref:Phosphoribosylglycinamide formyltransferase n=1 Tax=Corynebacterium epidermidicanis TaxID=1050174 RepID=A0A0G3GNF4_9CORY|nr:phosphoribosylglycinamide formyltransferase [Corynebacterium epidermidicanis]AKK02649.1 phosphoribosylglycinamide formyltransferase, formyltetrahydrofolate-dependent [Corynebacterium epidermidicanis]
MTKSSRRVVIMASGTGSLMEALIAASGDKYEVVGVVTDRQCPAVDKAQRAGIAVRTVSFTAGDDRSAWNIALRDAVAEHNPDIVVSAGFMRIVGPEFLAEFAGRMINTHPALLPSFPGAHAVPDALAYGVRVTGSTVHVVDEGVDTGRILAQVPVPVELGDDEETLHERIKVQERALIVRVLNSDNPLQPL